MSDLRTRLRALPARSPAAELEIEEGHRCDYLALAQFHYRSSRPGAVTTIYRLAHRAPTVVGRYLKRRNALQVVGVLVRTRPHLACCLRDEATGGRYQDLPASEQAVLLNREVRTLSRVVIHPQWRGLGLASRLVRHALAHPEPQVRYTEALAAMGRVHPFLERAGMTRYERPLHPQHARLLDLFDHLGLDRTLLASPCAVLDRVRQLDARSRALFNLELAHWHRSGSRHTRSGCRARSTFDMLQAARDQVLLLPVYFLFAHNSQTLPPAHPSPSHEVPDPGVSPCRRSP